VATKQVLWVRVRPDYEPLFSILKGLYQDKESRYWLMRPVAQMDNYDQEEYGGQMSIEGTSLSQMPCKALTVVEEYIQ